MFVKIGSSNHGQIFGGCVVGGCGCPNHFMEQVIVLQVARGGGVGLAPRPFKDQIIGNKRVTLNIGDYGSESSDVG